ncbi:hypothetical protein Hanom_Chr07g00674021 [Helianthus anomalus]
MSDASNGWWIFNSLFVNVLYPSFILDCHLTADHHLFPSSNTSTQRMLYSSRPFFLYFLKLNKEGER